MASITTYGKGQKNRYRVFINRKGVRATGTFTSLEAAKRWARETERAIDLGEFNKAAEKITLKEALDRYARTVSIKKRGARQEISKIKNLKRYKISKLRLKDIRPADIISLRESMEKKGYADATIRLYVSIVSHLFTVAANDWGLDTLRNPVRGRAKPPAPRGRDRRLEAGEEGVLLQGCKEYGGDIYDIVVFALETAMRQSEIASLTWKHVDLKKRVAHLPKTKNGESRDVPLSMKACALLEKRAKVRKLKDPRVFSLNPHSIGQAFRRVCERAGIEDLRFHDLRHEATSRLFERGLNQMQVASITGHKTLQMLKRYTHLRAEDLVQMLG